MLCWLGLWVNQADAFFSILNHFCGSPVLFLLHFRGNPYSTICVATLSYSTICVATLSYSTTFTATLISPTTSVATLSYSITSAATLIPSCLWQRRLIPPFSLHHFRHLIPLSSPSFCFCFCFVCHVPSWQTHFLLNELVMLLTHCSQWHLNKAYNV